MLSLDSSSRSSRSLPWRNLVVIIVSIVSIAAPLYFSSPHRPIPTIESLLETAQTLQWSKSVRESVEIQAPIQKVWDYVSDSSNAKNWSVFFDHISTLPGTQDGLPGSIRRCYRYSNEEGLYWDELTFESFPLLRRQIYVFNLFDFKPHWFSRDTRYFVLQTYESIDSNRTRLVFQTISEPTHWVSLLSAWIGRNKTAELFRVNLENIRAAIEGDGRNERPHPWNPNLLYWE